MKQRMEADGCGIDKWKGESGDLKEGRGRCEYC